MTLTAVAQPLPSLMGLLLVLTGLISDVWSQSIQTHHMVDGRVQIPAITQPLKLAEPSNIPLYAVGQKITTVVLRWDNYNDSGFLENERGRYEMNVPVNHDFNGNVYVQVIPLHLGKVQLTLFISFADGGVERDRIDLQVGRAGRPPDKLVIALPGGDDRRDTAVVTMDLSDANRKINLFASAIYKNVTDPISLKPSDVSFKIISSPGSAAEIDPSTGIVTARNIGQALLETTFGGASVLTCIDVRKYVSGGRRSHCEELLPPGRSLPPSTSEQDRNPPPVVKGH